MESTQHTKSAGDFPSISHKPLALDSRPPPACSPRTRQPPHPRPHDHAQAMRILLADATMLIIQGMFFVNHLRRLLDSAHCAADPTHMAKPASSSASSLPLPTPLLHYPCSAPIASRLSFLTLRIATAYRAAFLLPPGELWVPLVSTVMAAQLLALLLLPRGLYLTAGRRVCMVLIGLLPKAASLGCFLAFPGAQPSSYFSTYLPLEGAITVWQQLVYNYPFWPGMLVLAAHCALSTAICILVQPRPFHPFHPLQQQPPPLFNAAWILTQTYVCALLATAVSLQQNPAALQSLRAALLHRRRRRHRGRPTGGSGSGDGSSAATVPSPAEPRSQANMQTEGSVVKRGVNGSNSNSSTGGGGGGIVGGDRADVSSRSGAGEGGGGGSQSSGHKHHQSGSSSSSSGSSTEALLLQCVWKLLRGSGSACTTGTGGGGGGSSGSGGIGDTWREEVSSEEVPVPVTRESGRGSPQGVDSGFPPSLASSLPPSEPPSAAGSGSQLAGAALARAAAATASAAASATAAAAAEDAVAAVMVRAVTGQLASAAAPRRQDGVSEDAVAVIAGGGGGRTAVAAVAATGRPVSCGGEGEVDEVATTAAAAAAVTAAAAAARQVEAPLSSSTTTAAIASCLPARRGPQGPRARVMPLPPAGAFSLKQPTGLNRLTIEEDQEFQAPAAVAVGVSAGVLVAGGAGLRLGSLSGASAGRSGRNRRYRSRAPLLRVHMKVPWAEPAQLPGSFLERLSVALEEGLGRDCMLAGAAVRAGCIELVFDLLPQQDAYDLGPGSHQSPAMHRLLRSWPLNPPPSPLPHPHPHTQLLPTAAPQPPPPHPPQPHPPSEAAAAAALAAAVAAGHAGWGEAGGECEGWLLDSQGALEAAVLSGRLPLGDADPAAWIDALHLQPPPGAQVLTQACGRVWVSRWDACLRQWLPERAGGMRPCQLPRITRVEPPCILVRSREGGAGAGSRQRRRDAAVPTPAPAPAAGAGAGAVGCVGAAAADGGSTGGDGGGGTPSCTYSAFASRSCQQRGSLQGPATSASPLSAAAGPAAASLRVTVSNAGSAPAFSARCRGRYLPVTMHPLTPSTTTSTTTTTILLNHTTAANSSSTGAIAGLHPHCQQPQRQDVEGAGSHTPLAPAPLSSPGASSSTHMPHQPGGADAAAAAAAGGAAGAAGADAAAGGIAGGYGGGGVSGGCAAAAASGAAVRLDVPVGLLPRNGLVVVECRVGPLLSNWRPVLVTEDPRLAAELGSVLGGVG
ncbi:hypothetical protein Agub_g11534, partial [Astrephomene gubernaculifera]